MLRNRKYAKFSAHIIYLILFSCIVTLINIKVVNYRQLDRYPPDIKHILIWTGVPGIKFDGQRHFVENRCENVNCFFTRNRSFFGDVRYFDAIVFGVRNVSQGVNDFPDKRGGNQKYIFAASDSADNYPVCDSAYDGFFNWTWTYRRDSTIPYRFLSVYNLNHQKLFNEIHFKPDMEALTVFQKSQVSSKGKAAATFLDQCQSRSRREDLISALDEALSNFNLSVDVYGECGPLKCRRKSLTPCYYRLKKNYFFFLALEDSLAPDYVTDVVLHALKNDVVPIVYGGAKYQAFLPPNSYLDVKTFYNISTLAQKMVNLMKSKQAYYEYFRWKNHYSFEKGKVLDPCSLCENLNMPTMLINSFSYTHFRKWWNPHFETRCAN